MRAGTEGGPRTTALLAQRLRAAAEAVLTDPPARLEDDSRDADVCLTALVARLRDGRGDRDVDGSRRTDLIWLVLAALAGAYPSSDDVRDVQRALDLDDLTGVTLRLLDRAHVLATSFRGHDREAVVVTGVVADVDMCARFDFHNGIQRVAREVARRWAGAHPVTFAAWTETAGALRTLTDRESERALRWRDAAESAQRLVESEDEDATRQPIVLPWRANLVLLEVPLPDSRCGRIATLAELSGTTVDGIGYDAIPLVSADIRPLGEPNGFVTYLTAVKHIRRMAGISRSAAEEFRGFAHALAAQGLTGPDVHEVTLPTAVPEPPPGFVRTEPARPLVLSVGRMEPHKNHAALLHAAERLWDEGADFELCLVGGPGWDLDASAAVRTIERLQRAGRPVTWRRGVGDLEMWDMIRTASFTAFVSLHEGYGLPVAESLACGTPVLTTRYGSQGQIAADGGCLVVDPRDDDEVLAGLRRMVTEPGLRARLRVEAGARRARTWDGYADDLWTTLLGGAA
ncbi:glycosyltransferase [Cellulomonas sp. C5510]|uniref:glycosyltransferase n=1 Tax=Cellulomonas sp. C5510 TaxID=2871170 RepID=UPI001C964B0A|nr:glycosyltransferase [Cellulomonas sp. C5510]QZN84798.1 glycosyltransferase [Cellulomonas sp. C5510]